MQAQQGTFSSALAIDRLFSLGVQSRSKGAKGHTLGNVRRVEISEDEKLILRAAIRNQVARSI